MKQVICSDKAPKAIGPYSQGLKSGNILFVSGQIPLMPDGNVKEGNISEQTSQVMENIKAILSEAGLEMKTIIKTTIYLTDLNDFTEVNKVYGSYFSEPYPARATVQVAGLPKGAKIEIEAVAKALACK